MTEQEFLKKEQRVEQQYRDGFISLDQKRVALENLRDLWEQSTPKTLAELLAEMIRYGDIDEYPWPQEWHDTMKCNYQTLYKDDPELYTRCCIAASILGLANNTPAGLWHGLQESVKPFLQLPVEN